MLQPTAYIMPLEHYCYTFWTNTCGQIKGAFMRSKKEEEDSQPNAYILYHQTVSALKGISWLWRDMKVAFWNYAHTNYMSSCMVLCCL